MPDEAFVESVLKSPLNFFFFFKLTNRLSNQTWPQKTLHLKSNIFLPNEKKKRVKFGKDEK